MVRLGIVEARERVDRTLRGMVVNGHTRNLAELVAKDGGVGIVVDRGDRARDVAHLDSAFKTARGTTRDDDLRGSQGQASGHCCCRVRNANTRGDDDDGVAFELAKGVALLVVAIGAHNKGFNRVRTGKRRKSIQEGLCLHHHGALNEGVDLGKLTRRGQGQGHEYLSEKCLGAVRSE